MKIKQYIVTYNNSREINQCLEIIFESLSNEELKKLKINIINNHSNFKIKNIFADKVTILHNKLRPDFSTGHLSRSWNQAIINGFKDLNNPDADIVITNQDDAKLSNNYVEKVIQLHKRYDLITSGIGDCFVSYNAKAIKKIGLWDERFCNIGYQEADYFLRAILYNKDNVTINDPLHGRVHNAIQNILTKKYPTGLIRNEEYTKKSIKYHEHSLKVFMRKWGIDPGDWSPSSLKNLKPKIESYIYYPYFEKNIETLNEQKYLIL